MSVRPEELLTAQEIADLLRVKLGTIRRWQSQEGMPTFRIGRLVRYRQDEVMEWIEKKWNKNGSVQPDPAPASKK